MHQHQKKKPYIWVILVSLLLGGIIFWWTEQRLGQPQTIEHGSIEILPQGQLQKSQLIVAPAPTETVYGETIEISETTSSSSIK